MMEPTYDDGITGTILIEPDQAEMPLNHEEHTAISIPGTKTFRSGRKQEYDHLAEEARQIAD